MLVTVNDRRQPEVEPRWLDVLRWETCRVDPSTVETGDDLLDRIRKRLVELTAQADDRPLAVRVEVAGPCPAHRALAAEPHRWTNEIRALAQDVCSGDLWIEKVSMRTWPPADRASALAADGPIGELIQGIAELKSDPARLASLGGELEDLFDKLPPELKEGSGAIGLDRPERIREILAEAEQILVHQLLSREGAK